MSNEPTPPAQQPQPVTAAEIVSTDMPPVTGAAAQPASFERDSLKRIFDPNKFRTRDGKPQLDTQGRFVPFGGGRKRKTPNAPFAAQPQPAPQPSYIPREPSAPPPSPESGTPPETGEPAPAPAGGAMPAASAKAAAEVATNAGYTITGALIRDHKAARPTAAEHANLRDTTAAYIEARGLRFVGGVAIAIGFLAYLLGDERREKIWEAAVTFARKWRKPPMKDVTPAKPGASGDAPARGTTIAPGAVVSAFDLGT